MFRILDIVINYEALRQKISLDLLPSSFKTPSLYGRSQAKINKINKYTTLSLTSVSALEVVIGEVADKF